MQKRQPPRQPAPTKLLGDGRETQPMSAQQIVDQIRTQRSATAAAKVPSKLHRFVVAIDATESMTPYWKQVEGVMVKLIERATTTTRARVELRFVAYRDHCDGPRLLEASRWSSDPTDLRAFLKKVVATGGGDFPEAVDEALKFVIREETADPPVAVILIGDAPPHSDEPCERESRTLGAAKCPVHTVLVGQDSETSAAFVNIARWSGGQPLKLHDVDGILDLIALLIVDRIAGSSGVEEYARCYPALSSTGVAAVKHLLLLPAKKGA